MHIFERAHAYHRMWPEDYELERVRSYLGSLDYEGFFFLRGRLVPIADLKRLRSTIPAPYLNYVFLPSGSSR